MKEKIETKVVAARGSTAVGTTQEFDNNTKLKTM